MNPDTQIQKYLIVEAYYCLGIASGAALAYLNFSVCFFLELIHMKSKGKEYNSPFLVCISNVLIGPNTLLAHS